MKPMMAWLVQRATNRATGRTGSMLESVVGEPMEPTAFRKTVHENETDIHLKTGDSMVDIRYEPNGSEATVHARKKTR